MVLHNNCGATKVFLKIKNKKTISALIIRKHFKKCTHLERVDAFNESVNCQSTVMKS